MYELGKKGTWSEKSAIYGELTLKKMNLDTSLQTSPHSNQTVINIVEKVTEQFSEILSYHPGTGMVFVQ